MSTTEKELLDELKKQAEILENDPEFLKLKRDYLEAKEKGLIVKKGYNVAPLDTVGRRFHQKLTTTHKRG